MRDRCRWWTGGCPAQRRRIMVGATLVVAPVAPRLSQEIKRATARISLRRANVVATDKRATTRVAPTPGGTCSHETRGSPRGLAHNNGRMLLQQIRGPPRGLPLHWANVVVTKKRAITGNAPTAVAVSENMGKGRGLPITAGGRRFQTCATVSRRGGQPSWLPLRQET